jgi:hypothetical protein
MNIQKLFKKTKGKKCESCRGSGFRWGWWTLVITLPLSILLDFLAQALPIAIFILLLLFGLSFYANTFIYLFYGVTAIFGLPLIWYGTKMIFPKCTKCNGLGQIAGDV